jgi:uncharacterized metal-binding protein
MKDVFPSFGDLYREGSEREFLRMSALVEARGYGRWTRLREVAEFAVLLGVRRVGIAHGLDTAPEAQRVGRYLSSFAFETLLPPPDVIPDPCDQASFLQTEGVEMNVVSGLGVAAEAVFLKASSAPTVVLLARDRRLYHNPVAALYTSRSYLQDPLHGHWPRSERPVGSRGMEGVRAFHAGDPSGDGDPPQTRLEEAISVAHSIGASHVGLSFCVGFREEAKLLAKVLEVNDFQVSSVCCKTGATPKEVVGIREDEKIHPGRPEMICNPAAQAELLNRSGVEFALVLGQCVGHDSVAFANIEAPAVCLVAKDRVLAHNTVAALKEE